MTSSNPTIRHLFLAQAKGTPMLPVEEAIAVEQRGLAGDRHAKRAAGGKRQVLLMDAASHDALGLPPGTLKENIVVEGVPIEALPPGQRLALGSEVIVEITMICVPCQKLNAIRPGLLKASWGNRGMLARVLKGGRMRVGDAVTLLDVNPDAPRPIKPKLPG
ncbi:MAG: MOSC domain-containing protein [Candidatus Sericytochromatia bacterium]